MDYDLEAKGGKIAKISVKEDTPADYEGEIEADANSATVLLNRQRNRERIVNCRR